MTDRESVSRALQLADDAEARNDFAASCEILAPALRAHPDSAELSARLGRALRFCDRPGDAVPVLETAIARAPDHFQVAFELTHARWLNYEKWPAILSAEALVSKHPNRLEGKALSAVCEASFGYPTDALPLIRDVVRTAPDMTEYRVAECRVLNRLGRHSDSVALLQRIVSEQPLNWEAWLALAEAYRRLLRTGDWMKAARHAVDLAPERAQSQLWLARLRFEEGRYTEFLEPLQRAAERYTRFIDVYLDTGGFLWELNDESRAHQAFAHAVDLAPWHGPAVGLLAQFRAQTGLGPRPDLGRLERMALTTPYDRLPYFLGRIFLNPPATDYDRAYRILSIAVQCGPDDVDALKMLGDAQKMRDEYEDAIRHYGRAVELCPEYGVAWEGLGYCHAALHRFEEAVEAYRRAMEQLPKSVEAHHGYGDSLVRAGRPAEAIDPLEKAAQLAPLDGGVLVTLAFALSDAGRPDAALSAARRAQELLPDDEEVAQLVQDLSAPSGSVPRG